VYDRIMDHLQTAVLAGECLEGYLDNLSAARDKLRDLGETEHARMLEISRDAMVLSLSTLRDVALGLDELSRAA
jgi:hypothetical protein